MSPVDPAALLLLATANATPVIVGRLLGARFATPIDAVFGRDAARPIFGAHKTWRGLACGMGASALAGALLPCGAAIGLGFGALALAGDLLSSFVKRRLHQRSGAPVLLLDQLPESLLPLIAFARPLGLTALSIAGTAATFTLLDLLTARWRESAAPRATRGQTSPPDRPAPPGTH